MRTVAEPRIAHATPPVRAHHDRACRGLDTNLFYPEKGQRADRAKAICRLCDHSEECLDWALDTRQEFGIWGGRTPDERDELRRKRRTA